MSNDCLMWSVRGGKVVKKCSQVYDLEERIEKMTVNGLSPEDRLNGYRVVTDSLIERIKGLCRENANLREGLEADGSCKP